MMATAVATCRHPFFGDACLCVPYDMIVQDIQIHLWQNLHEQENQTGRTTDGREGGREGGREATYYFCFAAGCNHCSAYHVRGVEQWARVRMGGGLRHRTALFGKRADRARERRRAEINPHTAVVSPAVLLRYLRRGSSALCSILSRVHQVQQ